MTCTVHVLVTIRNFYWLCTLGRQGTRLLLLHLLSAWLEQPYIGSYYTYIYMKAAQEHHGTICRHTIFRNGEDHRKGSLAQTILVAAATATGALINTCTCTAFKHKNLLKVLAKNKDVLTSDLRVFLLIRQDFETSGPESTSLKMGTG